MWCHWYQSYWFSINIKDYRHIIWKSERNRNLSVLKLYDLFITLNHSSIEVVRSRSRGLDTKVLEGVIILTMYQIAIMNSTCQIYKRFDPAYIVVLRLC